jgi:acetyltransferase-like isoleucine patch superfamily enzyme
MNADAAPVAGLAGLPHGRYVTATYEQFAPSPAMRVARAVAGWLAWPVALPAAMIARTGDMAFRTMSEFFAGLPYVLGVVIRGEFYRFALRSCGRNVVIEYGTIFCYRDVTVGSNVLLGRYCVVHHCDIGSYVLAGERCTFLSGSRQHGTTRSDVPMALQPGQKKRIRIADDCWIGAHAVVMDDVGGGAVVGAGAVVTRPVPAGVIVAGNPAEVIRNRAEEAG